jgi:5-methylcytosine-specific restriction protein A
MTRFLLDPTHTDPARLKRERDKARELRASQWWKQKIAQGKCHYCGERFKPSQLTLDHVVPLARGGSSTKDNCVPCCKSCNNEKGLRTPVDDAFAALEAERRARGDSEE